MSRLKDYPWTVRYLCVVSTADLILIVLRATKVL